MDPTKERYRRVRGLILKLLAEQHPGTLDLRHLRFLLDDLNYPTTKEEFRSHVTYLADSTKGYVRVEERSSGGVTIGFAIVTPKGLDLLDGFTPSSDPGVDVEGL